MNTDFDILELKNISFSHQELLDYYLIINQYYRNYKWTPNDNIDAKNHEIKNLYSWAIQSNLKDPMLPCPPYDIKHDHEVTGTFDTPTNLLFGFAKKFILSLKNLRQTVIVGHPPGAKIKLHTDNQEFFKIHAPIITNDDAFFIFEKNRYNLKPGSAYLINTSRLHGTENLGKSDRVHFITKVRTKDIEGLINNDFVV